MLATICTIKSYTIPGNLKSTRAVLNAKDDLLVRLVHLLQEDEGDHRVGSQSDQQENRKLK